MPSSNPKHLRRAVVATAAIALIAAFIWSHGLASAASMSGATPSADVQMLSVRIAELERRIAELEALRAGAGHAMSATASAPTTVRAPFVILDDDGKTLMRVARSTKYKYPQLTVGDSAGSAAVLTSSSEGGVLQLFDATNKVRVAAVASSTKTGVFTYARTGKTFMGTNDAGSPVFQAVNLGGIAVAELGEAQTFDGMFVLTNETGDRMVVAGVATSGVGVVKTGPGGNGVAATMGNNGLPASEIQGTKKK